MIPQDDGQPIARLKSWRLEKKNDAGEVFEVIEAVGDGPPVVTFRREGLAPAQEYATTLTVALKG